MLGGQADTDNLFSALGGAEFLPGSSLDRIAADFAEGREGVAAFAYRGTSENMYYVPVTGTNWMLTYLIRDSIISEQINSISQGIVRRSTIQSVAVASLMFAVFAFVIYETRRASRLELEKETAEAESVIKREELESRIAMQEKLLDEERLRTQQEKLITALASDYHGVYYIELDEDEDEGICYQIHSELDHGFHTGEHFSFLRGLTDYAEAYVAEANRPVFLRFIQPQTVREGLRSDRVISFRYLVNRHGRESYEMIRFAGVRHPEDRDDHIVHAVSMCFMDVDSDTRRALEQSRVLSEALETAEDASRAKSAFLSNMSHEIRTPITGILGMNEMIRRESENEDVLQYSDNIQKAGVSLLGIINDILDFSKIEAGKLELFSGEYDLKGLLADSLNLVRLRAEEKGLTITAEIDPAAPSRLRGDELRVKQILTNLLTNAIKYTEKGTVRLIWRLERVEQNAAYFYVSVKDTGIGIRPEERDKLLSHMGGELEVRSSYGEGSEFFFTLRQEIVDAAAIGDCDPLAAPTAAEKREKDRTPFVAPEARVLVVDDTPLNLQVISGLLKRTRMRVETVESGERCIEQFASQDYDVVFLDYRMPYLDGIETLNQLKELYPDKAARTPVICLTASAISGDREKMLDAGFTDYLSKPVNIGEMEETLLRYLPAEKVTLTDAEEGLENALALLPKELFDIRLIDAELEDCLDAADVEGYTLKVHALKRTSRAVGALGLSERARLLEQAGDNGDLATIRRDTPALLAEYRSRGEQPLKRLFAAEGDAAGLPELPGPEFDEALSAIHDLCASYDDTSVQMVMDMLAGYSVPRSRQQQYRELKDAFDRVDWEELGRLTAPSGG